MVSVLQILLMVLGIAKLFIFAHFIMSWLLQFDVLNIRQPLVSQIWQGLSKILEPIYGPIRNVLPNMGGIDLSPIVALVAIYALEIVVRENLYSFA